MREEIKYNPVNENGDFISRGCIFLAHGILYDYTGVVHDEQKVYGIRCCMSDDGREHKFDFSEVETIFIPHNPKKQ